MDAESIDRMVIAIVDGGQLRRLLKALHARGFSATVINATGGFLHESKVTLLAGLAQQQLAEFFAVVRESCPSRTRYVSMGGELALMPGYPLMIEARVGGATVFVLPVEQFAQL